MATRLFSVLGLAFGDCGKGLFTDYLCRRHAAHTVVRFNGGGQAAHNVVLPDGRHHTFSQFGAGSFVPGSVTVLAYPVVVHPGALLVENEFLRRSGVHDGLRRLVIDGRCRVTTPYHQSAGRMRELERGAAAHGSCGVGVGETVRHSLEHPDLALRYADLAHAETAMARLEAIRRTLRAGFGRACAEVRNQSRYDAERVVFEDDGMSRRWLEQVRNLTRQVEPAAGERVAEQLHRPGAVVFEGAQGVLLDEWHGFHPHTTWSSTAAAAANAVAIDAGQRTPIRHFGVVRSYMTRHGNGPLPTHDARLDGLEELHNAAAEWQGSFRRGHPDAVLLRYAVSVAGQLDGVFVSHLDVFDRAPILKWCSSYRAAGGMDPAGLAMRDGLGQITALCPGAGRDLEHQSRLASLLAAVKPQYGTRPIASAAEFVQELENVAGLPVVLGSRGRTHEDVMPRPGKEDFC